MNSIEIDAHNLCLIDIKDILAQCEVDILNDLGKFDLIENFKFQHQDTKKIIYHHIIYNICNIVIHHMTFNKIILVYNSSDVMFKELVDYASKQRFLSFQENTIKKIKNILPIKIVDLKKSFGDIQKILSDGNGERIELINKLKEVSSTVDSFQKVKNFAKRYELNFLDNDFFHRVKTKNLMFSW